MASLLASLPAPRHQPSLDNEHDAPSSSRPRASTSTSSASSSALTVAAAIPAYGARGSWKPKTMSDFGDGGAYPECHVAQFPLEMGRKASSSSGNTLALQVDAEGNVRYDAIAQAGHREGRHVQSQFKDLVPMAHRTDVKDQGMERPSEEEVMSTAERTRAALEKLVSGKIKAVNPSTVPKAKGEVSYIRYTPDQGDGTKQRVIQMVDVVEDPLEPVRFKGKKIPRGPPSPPPPILRSPPRKVTAQEQKDWMIPPCVSNWKNNKGFTIPLDKRLAADGRGLQDVQINDRFAQFSEALYVADRHAREEVRQRSLMQQKIAQKEKDAKEENLRLLAQRAREERSGIAPPRAAVAVAGGAGGVMPSALAGYGSDSDDDSDAGSAAGGDTPRGAGRGAAAAGEDEDEGSEDEAAARARDLARKERNKEREREMKMSNMGTEQRAKQLARATGRDISEKIALGLAKPTMSKESMLDSRLFNQEQLAGNFGDEDSYNLYDKPLFSGSSAAAAIYKPRGANVDDEGNEVGSDEAVTRAMQNDRFGLGVAGRHGFEGSNTAEVRDGPVAFERDDSTTADPFAINAFLEQAGKTAAGAKRGLDTGGDDPRKRTRDD